MGESEEGFELRDESTYTDGEGARVYNISVRDLIPHEDAIKAAISEGRAKCVGRLTQPCPGPSHTVLNSP